MDRAPEHAVHSLVEIVEGVGFERAHGDGAGVVHQNVNAPEMAAGDGNQMVHLLGLADITGNGADFGTQALHPLAGTREFALVAGGPDPNCTLPPQTLRPRPAPPPPAT